MGRVSTVDVDAMVDRSLSLNEGAITLPNFGVDSWGWRMYAESGHFDPDKKLADYSDAEWERFLRGPEEKVEIRGLNLKWDGKRFTADVLEYRLRDANIADVLAMSIEEAAGFFTEKAVRPMLGALADVGLGYVRLGQPLTTLSGGERQRIKLAIAVDRAAEVLVLDEPTGGLHMDDVDKLVALMDALVERGRTLIVIEHRPRRRRGRRLGHRHGSWSRPRRRRDRVQRAAAGARGDGGLGDRAASRGARGGRVARGRPGFPW